MKIGILSCLLTLLFTVSASANDVADGMFCSNLAQAYKFLICNGVSPQNISIAKTSYHLASDITSAVVSAVQNDKKAGESCSYNDGDYYASHNMFFRHCLESVKENKTF